MIDVIHVPKAEAVHTATVIVQTLGVEHELSIKWIDAVAKFGFRWRPDKKMFMRPV